MNHIYNQFIILYLVIPLLALSGLFLGVIISYFTKEEIKAGRPWFIIMQKIIFIIICVILLNYFKISMVIRILIYILIILLLSFRFRSWIYYTILGVILGICQKEQLLYPTIASLIFLYGLPTGSLSTYKFKLTKFPKELIKQLILTHIHFIIINLVIYYLIH